MWPWGRQKRAAGFDATSRGTYFISHSYRDEAGMLRLLSQLPKRVEPFAFPPIKVGPAELVSSRLIDAILGCEGVIYLKGGASARSFWVAFERDYALRAQKPVYCYDPNTGTISRDTSPPLALNVFASYAATDATRRKVGEVLHIMRDRRFFFVRDAPVRAGPHLALDVVPREVERILEQGGYVVVFWSDDSSDPILDAGVASGLGQRLGRSVPVVFALLDKVALAEANSLDPERIPIRRIPVFGDTERSRAQRIDDLIVALYWLIYQDTRQNQFS